MINFYRGYYWKWKWKKRRGIHLSNFPIQVQFKRQMKHKSPSFLYQNTKQNALPVAQWLHPHYKHQGSSKWTFILETYSFYRTLLSSPYKHSAMHRFAHAQKTEVKCLRYGFRKGEGLWIYELIGARSFWNTLQNIKNIRIFYYYVISSIKITHILCVFIFKRHLFRNQVVILFLFLYCFWTVKKIAIKNYVKCNSALILSIF